MSDKAVSEANKMIHKTATNGTKSVMIIGQRTRLHKNSVKTKSVVVRYHGGRKPTNQQAFNYGRAILYANAYGTKGGAAHQAKVYQRAVSRGQLGKNPPNVSVSVVKTKVNYKTGKVTMKNRLYGSTHVVTRKGVKQFNRAHSGKGYTGTGSHARTKFQQRDSKGRFR